MKKSRNISFALLGLFVLTIFCRVLAGYFCSCNDTEDHHHGGHNHSCCEHAEHISECSHHDSLIEDDCCTYHSSLADSTFEFYSLEAKSINYNSVSWTLLYAVVALSRVKLPDASGSEVPKVEFRYLSISSQWSGVASSLRAPPVLV